MDKRQTCLPKARRQVNSKFEKRKFQTKAGQIRIFWFEFLIFMIVIYL